MNVAPPSSLEAELVQLKAALDEHAIVAITDPQGKITMVNDKFCAISKYSRAELLGQDHRLINSGHHSREFMRDLWTTIGRGLVWKGEVKNRAKDGTFYWVDTTIVPFLDDAGRPRQYVAIRADITERKRAEEEILKLNAELEERVTRRTTELEAANRELEAFSYSISHDLRAPLRAVNGFAGIVLEDFGAQLPEEGRRYLERVRNGGQRMGELIDDLLAFARLHRQPVKRRRVDMTRLVNEALEELTPQTSGRPIAVRVGVLPPCQGDPALLKQIWINLLSNAIKYNNPRGTVVLDCVATTPERIRISVTDSGDGLSPEKLAQLFQPFNRLGQETSAVEGTGIGLVVAKRLVELMDGAIGVESTVGVGSMFWIELRADVAPQLATEDDVPGVVFPASVPIEAPRRLLLYVEDNPANLRLVEQLITRRSDLRLLTAVNGRQGIELARSAQPDMILMDINLPDISGIEALLLLSEDPSTAHIPVVALSANAMPHDIEKGLAAGFYRYLTKPIKVKEFMDTLEATLLFVSQAFPNT